MVEDAPAAIEHGRQRRVMGTCDIPQNKIFWKFNFLGNYFIFGKFEFGKILPFMAIPNFEFVNCNKLL